MYDKHLETFIQAADSGSFLKASEKMFISANAVTKQINLLEERLEVKLFHRSPQGLALIGAGRLIYFAEALHRDRESLEGAAGCSPASRRTHPARPASQKATPAVPCGTAGVALKSQLTF